MSALEKAKKLKKEKEEKAQKEMKEVENTRNRQTIEIKAKYAFAKKTMKEFVNKEIVFKEKDDKLSLETKNGMEIMSCTVGIHYFTARYSDESPEEDICNISFFIKFRHGEEIVSEESHFEERLARMMVDYV